MAEEPERAGVNVLIIAERVAPHDDDGSIQPLEGTGTRIVTEANTHRITQEMGAVLDSFASLFDEVESGLGVALDEIELTLTVTAEGRVAIFGVGGSAGASGGIRVRLRRPPQGP